MSDALYLLRGICRPMNSLQNSEAMNTTSDNGNQSSAMMAESQEVSIE